MICRRIPTNQPTDQSNPIEYATMVDRESWQVKDSLLFISLIFLKLKEIFFKLIDLELSTVDIF